MNINRRNSSKSISKLFRSLSQPARVEILLAIGSGEACVCHLEALLNMRQAYISQHLMALREAGILATRREGRFIFYRLEKPQMLDFLSLAAQIIDVPTENISISTGKRPHPGCCCPHCVQNAAVPSPKLTLAKGEI